MSVTILEALQNAEINIVSGIPVGMKIAKKQLHNAIELLDKGYGIDTEVEPLREKFGNVENVPDLEEL